MPPSDGASSISVTVRVRPFTVNEDAQMIKYDESTLFLGDGSLAAAPTPKLSQKGLRSVIKVVDDKCLVFDPPEDNPVQKFSRQIVPTGKRVKDQTFGFDRIFDQGTTQGEVYEATTKPLLDSVLDGYNATIFAYGATGCGKTHTITGTTTSPGIIFLTMQELFEKIAEIQGEKATEISLSYLEIYNETIRDLLVPSNVKGGLMLREDANQAVSVQNLSSHRPENVNAVMDMIMKGNEMRTMSPTAANATSSRSHAVLQINVASKDRNADVNEPHTMATLSIIDLAGSERASATKNRGERLIEGANINKSLLALGGCINALCDPRKRNHVPYRNSKLTRLLKFSLGGNCKTVMIVCVSPSSQHFDETQNTLRYANRAKNIQTKVTRNVYNVNRHVKDFLVKIDEQMALINELRAQQKEAESFAFTKFKKQNEKKESIQREALQRIRAAYETSATERQKRMVNMVKQRQIGRRIALLSSWIAAFDSTVDNLDVEEPMKNMQAVRKTAQGIMVELENSRHHCNQEIIKSTWDRALVSALENGLRQLKEVDTGDNTDAETLRREVELIRANAEREALSQVAEQEKLGDAATMQVLLQAHFEVISSLESLNRMSVEEAVEAANSVLGKLLNSSSKAASHCVKPDGSLAPVEIFSPKKQGTPKRRKLAAIPGATPVKVANAAFAMAPHVMGSPRASPRRKGMLGSARKGVSFTPKKKRSPVKGAKRVVRWRDDTEDGTLAEFEKTPNKIESSPEETTTEILPPPQMSALTSAMESLSTTAQNSSSPIPAPPEPAMTINTKHNRFKVGALSRKSDGSPLSSISAPPRMTRLSESDSESSPLRNLSISQAQNRPSLSSLDQVQTASPSCDSASNASSSSSDTENHHLPKSDTLKIRSAIRSRVSSINGTPGHHQQSRNHTHRRRSPGGASGSPPSDNFFTASHVRRMVNGRNDKENNFGSVLSPRVTGVVAKSHSSSRRTTMGDGMGRPATVGDRAAQRLSSVHTSTRPVEKADIAAAAPPRASLMPGGKNVWR